MNVPICRGTTIPVNGHIGMLQFLFVICRNSSSWWFAAFPLSFPSLCCFVYWAGRRETSWLLYGICPDVKKRGLYTIWRVGSRYIPVPVKSGWFPAGNFPLSGIAWSPFRFLQLHSIVRGLHLVLMPCPTIWWQYRAVRSYRNILLPHIENLSGGITGQTDRHTGWLLVRTPDYDIIPEASSIPYRYSRYLSVRRKECR